MVYSSNSYLNKEQMTVNATYIMSVMTSQGWSKNAVAGMLGNMETESTINPGLWQSLNEGNMAGGYGLVQWTPASNYINWANSNGYDIGDINGQIARINFELENGLQYISTSEYPLSFQQFKTSNESPEYLASAFLKNYERAGVEKEQERRSQARYWFDNLDGEGGGGGRPHFPTSPDSVVTSPYGWRTHPDGHQQFHTGTDFAHSSGTSQPIYATQTGTVILNQWSDSGGWMIYIKHTGDPYYSRYIHLVSQSPITVGTSVTKGQEIGMTGNTGASYGIHLHFEIATSESGFGSESGTIDPEIYLQMDFGGGETPQTVEKDLITLLLVDALNGWKY